MGSASHPLVERHEEGEILLVDKPLNWTSFDVIHRLRRLFGIEKAGHAGTLDPKATGLLIVCTGKQTKNIGQFADLDKEYVGTFELGIRTPSYDLETEICERTDCSSITLAGLESVVNQFVGRQLQTPPMYSAVKHLGKPLYKYARKGETFARKAKEIEVHELSVVAFAPPAVDFRVVCSKGTYVRTLVNDIGNALGCGAVLTSLRRTRIGTYRVEDALTIEQLEGVKAEGRLLRNERNGHRTPAW